MGEIHRKTSSGIDVYFYPNMALHGFHMSLYVRAGSLYENEDTQGMTHFLEHIAIRNINYRMKGNLYRMLDKYGLEFNASTYRDMIQFYVSGAAERFFVGVGLLTELFSALELPTPEMEAERRRVKAEIREGDERTSLSNFTAAALYPDGTGRYPIVGTATSIATISRSALELYREEVMCAENIFLYVTGRVSEADIPAFLRALESCPVTHGVRRENVMPRPAAFGQRFGAVRVKVADYTVMRFNFDVDMTKVTPAECDLLYDLLFTGYNARFFLEMSERRGLCYDISGSVDRYRNIGNFSFSFEVKPKDLKEALACSVRLLREVGETPPKEEEIPRATYVDNNGLLYDDAAELNFTFAYDVHVLGCPYESLEDRKAAYAAVTPERLSEIAREIFRFDNCLLTAKGHFSDTTFITEILRGLF